MAISEVSFPAMGTDVHLIVVGGPAGLVERGRARIAELESRWSRFITTSEVSALTRGAGRWVPVSGDTELLVRRAADAWRLTGGAFDPTVLGDVIRAGYDRPFAELRPGLGVAWSPLGLGADGIAVRPGEARLAAGTGFDPGGIGKGLAADLVVEELRAAGADGVCANLGGDLRVWGQPPGGGAWTVAVTGPGSEADVARIGLADGAVATSSTARRRWARGDEEAHHVIDPRTGRPSGTPLVQATVVAGSGWQAEVLAKAVLLNGDGHPFDILGGTGAEALAVATDGSLLMSSGLGAFLGERVPALA